MKTLVAALVTASLVGCASVDQRMHDRKHYRQFQVEAIKAQSDARVTARQAEALEKQAMWNALAEVVKANPDAASNVAIVAAVAAARDGEGFGTKQAGMELLNTENEATAFDWAKILVSPTLNAVTGLGMTAITNHTQRAMFRQSALVDLAETAVDGKVVDVIGSVVQRESGAHNVTEGGSSLDMSTATSDNSDGVNP